LRFLVQRVSHGEVRVEGAIVGRIARGLVVLVGIGRADRPQVADRMLEKLLGLRIFPDQDGKMNRSVVDIQGELLLISQFTLYADCRRGRRPAFTSAAPPDQASDLFAHCVRRAAVSGLNTQTGIFAADMQVTLTNDGPVTILLDSDELGLGGNSSQTV